MSSWICLDASWVVQFVLGASRQSPLPALWQTWHTTGYALAAPTLLYYEVGNALYRYVRRGDLSPEDAAQALDIALEMQVSLHGDADLHRRAMVMARQFALPAVCDAHYLALAERLGAQLWTADRRLHQAVSATLTWVRCLE